MAAKNSASSNETSNDKALATPGPTGKTKSSFISFGFEYEVRKRRILKLRGNSEIKEKFFGVAIKKIYSHSFHLLPKSFAFLFMT